MANTNNTDAGAGQAATIGIGHRTSGEQGATPEHETMQETGGSGGEALTKPNKEEARPATPVAADAAQRQQDDIPAEPLGAGSDATAIARGFQDTRSSQASPGSTGLGTPETGGNQSEQDLAPPRKH